MALDPKRMLFTTHLRPPDLLDEDEDACAGCLFVKERSSVCHAAGAEAKLRGLDDCETGFIYVAVKTDPRQLDIFGEAACPTTPK